ncbi:hypothetical protein ES702_02303 [subsurface metagenome]
MENKKIDETGAVFNMAIKTLEGINDILSEISMCSSAVDPSIPYEIILYRKYKLIKQLFSRSIPLINDKKAKDDLKIRVKMLKFLFRNITDGRSHITKLACSDNADEILDDAIQSIQETLQKEKYFMPQKFDPRYSWKE